MFIDREQASWLLSEKANTRIYPSQFNFFKWFYKLVHAKKKGGVIERMFTKLLLC